LSDIVLAFDLYDSEFNNQMRPAGHSRRPSPLNVCIEQSLIRDICLLLTGQN